jgi:hypothetical protein
MSPAGTIQEETAVTTTSFFFFSPVIVDPSVLDVVQSNKQEL